MSDDKRMTATEAMALREELLTRMTEKMAPVMEKYFNDLMAFGYATFDIDAFLATLEKVACAGCKGTGLMGGGHLCVVCNGTGRKAP